MTDVNVEQAHNLAGYIEQLGIPKTLEDAIRERDAWVETATQFSRNEEYYTGLLDKIAASLGSDAYTSDDGSVYEDPVRAKLPELIAHRLTALSSASGDVVAWQSIETAPRDGTLIVGLDRTAANTAWMYPFVMQWDRMHWHWNDGLQWKRWPGDGPFVWAPIPLLPTSALAASAREVKA